MIIDIFSRFDPGFYSFSGEYRIVLFWLLSVISVRVFIVRYWTTLNRISGVIYLIKNFMFSQSSSIVGSRMKGFDNLLVALFVFIIIVNFIGLIPYVFRVSSHLVFRLSFGLPIWLRVIISGIIAFISSFLGYLLPGGAPGWLNPFLVLVETVRIFVRPITISFRLAANMRAGHIVLTLIGVYAGRAFFGSVVVFILLVVIQVFYIIFELGICLIQGYIFCLLASLYRNDHPLE